MAADLFQTLRKDHREVRQMFEELMEEKQSSKRQKLLEQIQKEIVPHMKGEEKAIYTLLAKNKDAQEHAFEAFEEHHAADLLLDELMDVSVGDERFTAKVTVLHEVVEHHIKEEEKELFKDMRKVLSEDQLNQALKSFEQEKESVKKGLA